MPRRLIFFYYSVYLAMLGAAGVLAGVRYLLAESLVMARA
jgi:hypothetical protein